MRFNRASPKCRGQRRLARLQDWHHWFAWRPVYVDDNTCVWLERVMRKGTIQQAGVDVWWSWEYRV